MHCYLRADGLGGTVITDHDYPKRVAYVFLTSLMDKFVQDNP